MLQSKEALLKLNKTKMLHVPAQFWPIRHPFKDSKKDWVFFLSA